MTPTQVDRRTFLKRLQASGLLEPAELKAVVQRLPETNRGRLIARLLVDWGLLTRFQAGLLMAGRTSGFVLGQYRILDQIGQGGMGRVYKAVHQTMGRVVALKVLAPQHLKTERARELFRREVRAVGRLSHPNIVTAYDASCADGRHYLAMEYVDGPNLDQLLHERGPLPVGLACEMMRQAALGLQYAHEQGMVHRDIKPHNLLIQRAAAGSAVPFVVKILDFGLARLQGPREGAAPAPGTILAPQNVVMGTPDYLSPEQSRSMHGVDIRSDLYALGCTLYHLLAGEVPFPGGKSLEKLIRQATEEPEPVESYRPELPEAVGAVLRRLMAKDPARRFQTPGEAAAALAPLAAVGPADWPATGDTVEYCADAGSTSHGNVQPAGGPADPSSSHALDADLDVTPFLGSNPTPLSLEEDLALVVRERNRERRRGRWKVLFSSVAILAVLTGLVVLLIQAIE